MPVDFVGREVEVRLSEDEGAAPLAFRLGQREHVVAEQLATWAGQGFGGRPRGRDRPRQPERRYYRLRTEDGEVYELYAEWSPARRRRAGTRWYVHRRLTSAPESAKAEEPAEAPTEGEPASEEPASEKPRPSAPARRRRGG